MPLFRSDLLFNMQESGFSESWVWTRDNIASAEATGKQWAAVRAPLCNVLCRPIGLRTSPLNAVGIPSGRGKMINLRTAGLPASQNLARDQFTTGYYANWYNADGTAFRKTWMHGFPDDWVKYNLDGTIPEIPALTAAFNNLKNFLFGVPALIPGSTFNKAGNPAITLTRVETDNDGVVTVQLSTIPSPAWERGQRIRIKGYKGTIGRGINGRWTVASVSNDQFGYTLRASAPCCPGESDVTGGGAAARDEYEFFAVAQGFLIQPTGRRIGRPFFSPRGRRSKGPRCAVTRAAGV